MKKFSFLFAFLCVSVMMFAATDVVKMKGFGGLSANNYQNVTVTGTSENGVGMVAYAFNASNGQVRGNKTVAAGATVTSADANKNWSLYNTEAMPGAIKSIKVTQTATGDNKFQNNIYVALGTASQGAVTSISGAVKSTLVSGQEFSFSIDEAQGYTYFKILSTEKFTSNNVAGVVVEIEYAESNAPELTPATWYGAEQFVTENEQKEWTAFVYGITRNADKTLTYEMEFANSVTGLVVEINDGDYRGATAEGLKYTYTTADTHEDGETVNGFFWIKYANGVTRIDYTYTVGAENEKPAMPEKPAEDGLKGDYKIGGEQADYATLAEAFTAINEANKENKIIGDIRLLVAADITEPKNVGIQNSSDYTITLTVDAAEARKITFTQSADNAGPSGNICIGCDMTLTHTSASVLTQNVIIDGSFGGDGGKYLTLEASASVNSLNGTILFYGNVKNSGVYNTNMILLNGSGSSSFAVDIRTQNASTLTPTNVVVANNYIENTLGNASQGIQIRPGTGTVNPNNISIIGNEIVARTRGIFIQGCSGTTNFIGNTFRINQTSAGMSSYGIWGYAKVEGTINIDGNKFLELGTGAVATGAGITAIQVGGAVTDKPGTGGDWVITNNYITGFKPLAANTSCQLRGIASAKVSSVKIAHNTVVLNQLENTPSAAVAGDIVMINGNAADLVKNNLVVSYETAALNTLVTNVTESFANNVYYAQSENTLFTTDCATFEAYKDIETTAQLVKPNFVDAANGNLDLLNATEEMLMPRLEEVLTDIYGTDRAEMTCAGAFETTNIIDEPFDPEELFDPALASTNNNYFAPGFNPGADAGSSATYEDGVISVDLKSNFYGQWNAQVKLNHNVDFSAEYQYVLSCKFHATAAVNKVTIKLDDNTGMIYENQTVNLPADEDYVYTSVATNGIEGNNKVLVFDFGWAAPCQITISDISIKKVGKAVAPPAVEHPEAAPAPTRAANNVFSIYSDAYTTNVTRGMGSWGQMTIEQEVELAEGDHAMYYTTANYLGWELNGNNTIGDMTAYPNLHMDIYVAEAGTIEFTPIWGAEAGKEYSLIAGWNQIDIVLTTDFAGINLANIYQLKWANMPETCYIDNVYFYNEGNQGGGEGTGLDNVNNNVEVKKVMIDGQVYIIRDGVRYNVMGMQVR